MARRSAKRKFEGISDTRIVKRVVVCGGKVLRHKVYWQQHRKELEVRISKLTQRCSAVLSTEEVAKLLKLQEDLEAMPSTEIIETLPTLEHLRDQIHSMARRTTVFMSFFSQVLLFHVHRWIEQTTLPFPPLDQKLRMMCSPDARTGWLAVNREAFPEFAESVALFLELLPTEARSMYTDKNLLGDLSQPLNYEMQRHAVAISNHLVYNFSRRCVQWITFRTKQLEPGLSARVRKQMVNSILGRLLLVTEESSSSNSEQLYQPPAFKATQQQEQHMTTILDELKTLLPPPSLLPQDNNNNNESMTTRLSLPLDKDRLKDHNNWPALLRFYSKLNALFAAHKQPQFDMLPLCAFRTRCVSLDHRQFCSLFHVPVKDRASVPWSRFLRLSHVHLDESPGPNKKTPSSVQTDGIRFIVHCETFVPKDDNNPSEAVLVGAAISSDNENETDLDKEIEEEQQTAGSGARTKRPKTKIATAAAAAPARRIFESSHGVLKMTRLEGFSDGSSVPVDIIGVDPGVRDIYAVVDGQNHYSRLTRRQYDSIVGVSGNRRKLQKWKDKAGISVLENGIAVSSASTRAEFEKHVKTFFSVAPQLHEFYGAKRVSQMRFSQYVRRDKLIDGFINQVFLDESGPSSKRKKQSRKNTQRRRRRRRKATRVDHSDAVAATRQKIGYPNKEPDNDDQKKIPPVLTTSMGKKKKKCKSGSERRKRKRAKQRLQKTTKSSQSQSQPAAAVVHKNAYLRREHGDGKQSLLQAQQHSVVATTTTTTTTPLEPGGTQKRKKVVAFGAATFNRALRGWSGTPGKRLCYRLQQRLPVILVDEYMTSQISNATLEKLNNIYCWKQIKENNNNNNVTIISNGTVQMKKQLCWGLKEFELRCDNNNNDNCETKQMHRRLVDRNRNAAANIRDLLDYWLQHHDRPSQFKR